MTEANTQEPVSTEITKEKAEPVLSKQERVEQLVSKAKQAAKEGEYGLAVECYTEVLSLLQEHENDDPFRPQLAPIYYAYGVCLLQHSMQQNCLLGDTVPDTLPAETKEAEAVSEDEGEHKAGTSKLIQLDQDDSEEEVEGEEVLDGSYVPTVAEIVAQEALEKTLDSYDDLQLAWEVLDMSRVIYSKQPSDKANDLRLAEVNIALGDVSLESEQFDVAVSDYKSALSLKMHWLEPSDRAIAELYYKIGCAYELDKKISDAMEHVGRCLELLQSRGELLEKQNNNDQYRMDELADLKSLYPDLEAKLEDLKSVLNTHEDEQVQPSKAPVTPPSVVHDVTSLIKRKYQASVAAKTQIPGDFDLPEPIKRVKKDSSLDH